MKKLMFALFATMFCLNASVESSEIRDYDFEQEKLSIAGDTIYTVSSFDSSDFIGAYTYFGAKIWETKFNSKVIAWRVTQDYVIVFSKNRIGTKTFLTCLDRQTGSVIWERP